MKPLSKFWTALTAFALIALYLADLQQAAASQITGTEFVFEVSAPVVPKISLPVHSLPLAKKLPILNREINPLQGFDPNIGESNDPALPDSLAPFGVNGETTPDPLLTFEGLGTDGLAPPDPVGDVGSNHYIQMVNISFQIWDKGDPDNGTPPSIVQPDTPFNQLFTEFGGPCEIRNDGNPIVLYDDQADRWLLSQFTLGDIPSLCVAVSTSPDPTGTYALYEFPMPGVDAPKLAAWSDAYYVGTSSGLPNGYNAHALERDKILSGLPAMRQSFLGLANFVMPADADGQIPPPAGEPGIFYTMYAEGFETHPPGVDRLAMYEFDVDWDIPDNSTFVLAQEIPVAGFNYTVCGFSFAALGCIPQPETPQTLDARSNWPMFRFQYRSFGNFASLVGNFTVDVNGEDRAAIRWFEIRKTAETYSLYQEGTYAPDEDHRWLGSIAMDASGNLALGYSVSSETTIPSIRYTSRLASDPPGTLAAEAELWPGTGVQTGLERWGDYANLVVDPVDGCHFWFTSQYHDLDDSGFNWNTRVGVFKIPTCGGNTGTLTGQVTNGVAGLPGAQIQARATITQTGTTSTGENGSYALSLSEGTYVVTATAYGYLPGIVTGVEIISGTTTLQNFTLAPAPNHTISGQVFDAVAGWPLYAEIYINGYPGNPIWTNPETGAYTLTLPEGTYTFEILAWDEGYLPTIAEITVNGEELTLNFGMNVNAADCNALGYVFNGTVQAFDQEIIPPGWETVDNINLGNPQVWLFDDPAGRGNLTGGTGPFAIIDSDYYGPLGTQDTSLITPLLDFSDLSSVSLAFDTDFKVWEVNSDEDADVDVSTDGGETWTNVWHRGQEDGSYNGHVILDISALAANESEVLIQFRYYDAAYEWWWQVDNVAYGALSCDPLPGGLVVGNVYDANTEFPLDNALLTHSAGTSTTTSTPGDPFVDDGFYYLFSPQGNYTLTATLANYGLLAQPMTIENGTTTRQDFSLPAGWLVPTPGSLSFSLAIGYTATIPLQLNNLGGISATFIIVEAQNRLTDILWLTASPPTGTIEANTTLNASILLDTTSLTQTSVYTANLIIENDTPYGAITLPITLTVGPPSPSVSGGPELTGVGMPGTTISYSISITNTGNIPDTFTFLIKGNAWETTLNLPSIFLNPGSHTSLIISVSIPLTAGYLEAELAKLVILGDMTGAFDSTLIVTTAKFPYYQFFPFVRD